MEFIDIGFNMVDAMYDGKYHGKTIHPVDRDCVMRRAADFGCRAVICTGGTLTESAKTIELARRWNNLALNEGAENEKDKIARTLCYTTVGCHPTRCLEFERYRGGRKFGSATKEHVEEGVEASDSNAKSDQQHEVNTAADAYTDALDQMIQENKDVVVAVGECGLDYDRLFFCPAEAQLRHFPRHFALAKKHNLPMFLHDRNTGDDFYNIMKQAIDEGMLPAGGVVHSFTGSLEQMQRLVNIGLYIGVNGCSMKTEENLDVVRAIPLDKLLLETDAPWCDIRPTHASAAYLWPSSSGVSGPASGGKKGGRMIECSKLQQKQGKHDSSKSKSADDEETCTAAPGTAEYKPVCEDWLNIYKFPFPLPPAVKPEKWVVDESLMPQSGAMSNGRGCCVKGRNEPAMMFKVFEVVYNLRAAEVHHDPRRLAGIIRDNTIKLFRLRL